MFKLGTVDVYVRPLLKMQADLEPLSGIVPEGGDTKDLKIPGVPKEQKGWDVEWEMEDDVALLRGVHRYGLGSWEAGLGSWEAVKMDPYYGLVEKIWLKDKNKKPQAKHLQAGAEFLLKYLARYTKSKAPKTARQHKKPKKTSPTGDGGKNSTGKDERKRKREPKAVVEEKPEDRRREHKAKTWRGGPLPPRKGPP